MSQQYHPNEKPALSFDQCCKRVLKSTADGYAKAYAQAGIGMVDEEMRVQALYLRNNLSTWRGPEAREVKAALDWYGKKRVLGK